MLVLTIVVAAGVYTPLYGVFYKYLPKFNSFRGVCKVYFIANLFLCMLAAAGYDALLRPVRPRRWTFLAIVLGFVALLVARGGFAVRSSGADIHGFWAAFLKSISQTQDLYLIPPSFYTQPNFIARTASLAASQLFIAAGTLFLLALIVFMLRYHRVIAYLLIVLAAVELFGFARGTRSTMPLAVRYPDTWANAAASSSGEYRVLHVDFGMANLAMSRGLYELWGYDPGVLKRYAQFMAFTQHEDVDGATQYLQVRNVHPFYRMLRCRFVFVPNAQNSVLEVHDSLPHLLLVQNYELLSDRDAIFRFMDRPAFDPRKTVVLETPPVPRPLPAPATAPATPPGRAEIVRQSTDEMEIKVDLDQPAILLVTDNYSAGWRIKPISMISPQPDYQILPANYVLRAVPLAAGKHHFLMQYLPVSFVIGKWITICSVIVYVVVGYATLRKVVP